MPGQDGTGPLGQGPLTGRGLGPCGRGLRRGFRFGRGLGLGWRCWATGIAPSAPVTLSKEDEKKILEAELEEIETEKQEIEKRLKGLK
ncbi:MAG: DUF5320 domain-containing protein [Candidatus Pacearchaeota archaeon]